MAGTRPGAGVRVRTAETSVGLPICRPSLLAQVKGEPAGPTRWAGLVGGRGAGWWAGLVGGRGAGWAGQGAPQGFPAGGRRGPQVSGPREARGQALEAGSRPDPLAHCGQGDGVGGRWGQPDPVSGGLGTARSRVCPSRPRARPGVRLNLGPETPCPGEAPPD